MKTTLSLVLATAISVLLTACQSTQTTESYTQRQEKELADFLQKEKLVPGEPVTNVFNSSINGFKGINDTNLLMYAGVNDTYLVKLSTPCFDLRHALTVGLASYSDVVNSFDNIVIRSSFNQPQSCMIDKILQVSEEGA